MACLDGTRNEPETGATNVARVYDIAVKNAATATNAAPWQFRDLVSSGVVAMVSVASRGAAGVKPPGRGDRDRLTLLREPTIAGSVPVDERSG